ncbi:hypothetical protein BGZ46_000130, partial [Entomortierella lignicola]
MSTQTIPTNNNSPKGPQQQCFDRADENQHRFFVAKQFLPRDSKRGVNSYQAFKTVHHFLQYYDNLSKQHRTFMELIREGRPCLEYYDIEWKLNSNPTDATIAAEEQAVLSKLQTLRNEFAPEYLVDECMFRVSSASSISRQKGSLHVVVFQGEHAFHNNHTDMNAFMIAFKDYIEGKESEGGNNGNCVSKCIDWVVYNRNRPMRCLGSTKCSEPNRPFIRAPWHASSRDSPAHEFYITNVSQHLRLVDLNRIEKVPKNCEPHRPSLHYSSVALNKDPVSVLDLKASLSESSSTRSVVDAALRIFHETNVRVVAMSADDDEELEDEDEDEGVFNVVEDVSSPLLSISQSLTFCKGKNSSRGNQPEYQHDAHRKECIAFMATHFMANSVECSSAGMIVALKRTKPGWCGLCNRSHDRSDAYLSISLSGNVSLGCYRNLDRKVVKLGVLIYSDRITMRDTLITPRSNKGFECHESLNTKYLEYNAYGSSLVIRSPPGTAKTQFTKTFVQKNPQYIYVAVSCRRTLAQHLCRELKFINYMDAPPGKICGTRIVVQAESMWRLDLDFYRRNQDKVVFILDEFASLVEQFNSKTMGHRKGLNIAMFEQFIRLSFRIITLDADLTNAHTAILKEYRNDLHILNNTYEAHAGYIFEFHASEKHLQDRVVNALRQGKRLWICSTHSAKYTEAMHRALEKLGFYGTCVTSLTDESVKRDIIQKITTVLDGKYQYFIHTPTISVGVDFNIPDKADFVVGFFDTHSDVTVETCLQMLRRPRQVKEKTYLLHMRDRFSNLPTTEESLKEWLCDQDQMIHGGATDTQHLSYDGSADFKLMLEDTLYVRMYILTKITKNLSKNDFVGRFIQQVKDAGGLVRGIDKSPALDSNSNLSKDIKRLEAEIQVNKDEKIALAPNIGFLKYEELRNRQGSPNEHESDKYSIRKYYLQNTFKLKDNFDMTAEWVGLYNSEKEIEVYQNLCKIQGGIESSLRNEQAREREILDLIDSDASKTVQSIDQRAESKYTRLKYATDMLHICGFKDVFSKDIVSRKTIEGNLERAWPEIIAKIDKICTTLDIPQPTHKKWEFRYQMLFMRRVMEPVLGLIVKATNKHSHSFEIEHHSNV